MNKNDKKLEDVVVFSGQYEDSAENSRIEIPEGIIEIAENAFRDFENIERVDIPDGGAVSDLVCRDGQYFVLSFSRNADGGFTNTVWELKADDEFSKMVSFKTDDAYGLSFEFDGERFYVALGNRSSTDGVGSLCIIDVS